jgi:hypothetical protein
METKQQLNSVEQDQQPSIQSSSNDITLVPFVFLDDEWTAGDDFLTSLWVKTDGQKLASLIYWEGSVRSAQDFISMAKSENTVMVFAFKGQQCAGYAWLGPVSGNYALPHFCFFKEYWGDVAKELGHSILDYWFSWRDDDGPLLDVLIGIIPDVNVNARNFVQVIGATHLGIIPNMFKNKQTGERRDAHFYYWNPERG